MKKAENTDTELFPPSSKKDTNIQAACSSHVSYGFFARYLTLLNEELRGHVCSDIR